MPRATTPAASPTRGRQASFKTKVLPNGSIVVNKAYTNAFEPGTEFFIKISDAGIRLIPA